MKSLSFLLLIAVLIFAGCGSKQTVDTTPADSTAIQTYSSESLPSPTTASYQPPQSVNNFPDYSYGTALTEDELEVALTEKVDKIISDHDQLNLLTFRTHSIREREYSGDYDEVTESTEVTETWFFDGSFKLRAYSKKYYRDGEGRDTRIIVQIYAGDSVIAASEYRIDDGQIGMSYNTKILASNCPKCGVASESEAGSSGKVTDTFSDMSLIPETYADVSELADANLWKNAQRAEDVYQVTEHLETWTDGNETYQKPYDIEYSMSKDLFSYWRFKKFTEQFAFKETEMSKEDAALYLDGEDKNIYTTTKLLESEPFYFLLYNAEKHTGGDVYELYAVSFTKDGQRLSNMHVGSSYQDSRGWEEDYLYEYDEENHVLTVTGNQYRRDERGEGHKSEKVVTYKLTKDGSIESSEKGG